MFIRLNYSNIISTLAFLLSSIIAIYTAICNKPKIKVVYKYTLFMRTLPHQHFAFRFDICNKSKTDISIVKATLHIGNKNLDFSDTQRKIFIAKNVNSDESVSTLGLPINITGLNTYGGFFCIDTDGNKELQQVINNLKDFSVTFLTNRGLKKTFKFTNNIADKYSNAEQYK